MTVCPSCGTENPDGAKFCNACATPLEPERAGRKERKFATALFADLVGSTTLAEREDPEVVQSIVGRTFDRLSEEIARYEGLLEKFMGDAVLAVFGVPRAHEDDAERAVRAALEMGAVLSELNRGFAAEGKPTLEMRIGIEAGEVLVDLERASGPRDRMLTGDAVNTAARLQTSAEPGRVVVGPAVYASTKDVIDFRELEPLALKGKAEPVPAWEALRIKARTRGERPHLGLESRLVGRDEELAVMKQTLRRVESEGRPALVTVIGPAGVGKSRLVSELERFAEGLPQIVYWRRGRCLAYANTSYSALADAIKAQCEIFEDDTAEVAAKKADAAVRELFGDEEVTPQIRALVGAGDTRGAEPRGPVRGVAAVPRAHGGPVPGDARARRHPLGRRRPAGLHRPRGGLGAGTDHGRRHRAGRSCSRPARRGAGASGTRRRCTWTRSPRPRARRCSRTSSPASSRPSSSARSSSAARATRSYVEEIVRKLIDDGVLRATEASRWEVASPAEEIELPRSIQGFIAARLDGLPEDEKAGPAGRGGGRTGVLARHGRRAHGPRPDAEVRGGARAAPGEGARRARTNRPRSRTSTSSRSATT